MVKKIISFLAVIVLVFSLTSCGGNDTENIVSIPETAEGKGEAGGNETSAEEESGKVLIAYFSWAENAIQDDIDAMTSPSVKAPGNVAQFALWIAEKTGGELFSIQVTEPYPAD